MKGNHRVYPPEYPRQMVKSVQAGRNSEELSREFEPTAHTIRNWVRQADRDEGRQADGLTTEERKELSRLRREVRQLRLEREIVARAACLRALHRQMVGWSMASHLRTELVLDALNMALWRRRPAEVIHHSDHGSQYTSVAFGKRCREAGIRPSMGSVGDCLDNALCESFFATLECELLDRVTFRTRAEARRGVFEFIEGWYNTRRRHSALDYLSPMEYERRHCVPS